MRFLITGGAGFIGSHLSDLLVEHDHTVHVLDDLSTGAIENIRHLKRHPCFEYTIGSAANHAVVAELVDDADVVVHLAAAVGVTLVVDSPVRAIETNVHCTEVVLEHASKKKKPVLIASTSEVYGKSQALPFREDGDMQMGATDKGRWAYACSKAIDEFLADRLLARARPADHGRAPVQHGRTSPDRVLRHGRAEARGPGARRRAADRLRRWPADTLLLPRRRRRAGPVRPDERGARLRERVQRRREHRDLDPRPRPSDHRRDRLRTQRSS